MRYSGADKNAWLDQVLEAHRELKQSIAELRGFVGSPQPEIGMGGYHTWAAACAVRLVELHDHLFRHFRFEEKEGVLHDLSKLHPQALARIEAIEREHPQMLDRLRGIVADVLQYSEGSPPADSRIRIRITELLDLLHAHEEAEMDLIQRVIYREVGAGD